MTHVYVLTQWSGAVEEGVFSTLDKAKAQAGVLESEPIEWVDPRYADDRYLSGEVYGRVQFRIEVVEVDVPT